MNSDLTLPLSGGTGKAELIIRRVLLVTRFAGRAATIAAP
jgi:hypothetical protein